MKPFGEFDFSEEFIEHNRPHRSIETEPTPEPEHHYQFNWVAFFTMIAAIIAAILVGFFIPGPADDILMQVVIASIHAFIQANNFKKK